MGSPTEIDGIEDVESFRSRAREWIAANLPIAKPVTGEESESADYDEAAWERARELQKLLYSGGFAGLCYPTEYGGQGLTPAHQYAFNEEVVGFEMPQLLNSPTFSICGPTILDLGTEEQKKKHLSAMIRGEETLVQFLSEPGCGSDLAGVVTRADRDGDVFVLNGSKIWSSWAYAADYALCLARTDWDAPKHRGLTMFLLEVHQPGIELRRIRQVNGNEEFCQEFFDNVEVPVANVVGEINGGWTVASRQMFHERNSVGGGSQYVSGKLMGPKRRSPTTVMAEIARRTSRSDDRRVRELIAESHVIGKVQGHLIERVVAGMRTGDLPPSAGSIIRLFGGLGHLRQTEITLEVSGPHGTVSLPGTTGDREIAETFITRQAACMGGGTTEIARNIIAERVLGMPREFAADRDVPYKDVRRSR
ncbi:acyl-CoA dehydrogenase family protein [Nocardia salmonicida]|uniref:Acyl-CoA dehydrogenase family protein n=1 Tax=Nocardia salmonicida TaxID=53431 RepID=A0ABZ1N398_9NOCA